MPRSRSSSATSARLSQFRGASRPLPPGDKRVLVVVLIHLCFLPWALGTMHGWSQITSLVLALIGFRVAFWPTAGSGKGQEVSVGAVGSESGKGSAVSVGSDHLPLTSYRLPQSTPWRRLLRFPPFWLGLALLGYIAAQALNPSWRYARNDTTWWLTAVPNLSWLPTSVDVPFARFSVWRQFIIYASAWLTLCTVAIGLTRRRSFGVLLTALALNGLVLVLVGLFLRLTQPPDHLLWLGLRPGTLTFASIIYKNHAGAYLALIATALLGVAARYRERSLREQARSSPALLPVLGALAVFFAVVFTYSRGATLLLGGYLVAAGTAYALHRYFARGDSSTPRVVTFTVAGMVAFVVVFALAQLDFRKSLARFEMLGNTGKQDMSVNHRLETNEASWDMLANIWPRGVGAGGFRHVFPLYISRFEGSYQGGRLFWQHAHNDWLQIPIEQGAVGSGLILAGGLWWLWRLGRVRVWRSLPAVLLALGLFQTLAHAAIDFPLQNPAILITWVVLALVAARYAAPESAVSGKG